MCYIQEKSKMQGIYKKNKKKSKDLTGPLALLILVFVYQNASGLILESETMQWSLTTQSILCQHAVHVSDDHFDLHCEHLQLWLQDSGELLRLEASEQLRIHAKDLQATADQASYDASSNLLKLSGHVHLQDPKFQAHAETLDLNTQTRQVHLGGRPRVEVGVEVEGLRGACAP